MLYFLLHAPRLSFRRVTFLSWKALVLQALAPVPAGAELFLSYGPLDSNKVCA
jgi:hypothetical protein